MRDAKEGRSPGRKVLGCLIKGPLGCMAFMLGAGTVLVFFLPSACGQISEQYLEDGFAAAFEGQLDVSDAWLGSLYGAQEIGGITLRDPEGREVLRGEIRAPSLAGLLDSKADGWGPVEIRVEHLFLRRDTQGRNNLVRALTPRATELDRWFDFDVDGEEITYSYSGSNVRLRDPGRIPVQLFIERVTWQDLNEPGAPEEIILSQFEGQGFLSDLRRGKLAFEFRGRGGVEPGSNATVEFGCFVDDVANAWHDRDPYRSDLELHFLGVPSHKLDLVTRAQGRLADALGEKLHRLNLRSFRHHGKPRQLELELDADAVHIDPMHGYFEDGVLTAVDEAITLEFHPIPFWSHRVVGGLVPLAEWTPEREGALGRLELRDFRLPLDGSFEDLTGEFLFELDDLAADLRPELRAAVGIEAERELGEVGNLALIIDGGVVHYRSLRLGSGAHAVELEGKFVPHSGEIAIDSRWPGLWFGKEAAVQKALAGTWAEPRVESIGAEPVPGVHPEPPPSPTQPPDSQAEPGSDAGPRADRAADDAADGR